MNKLRKILRKGGKNISFHTPAHNNTLPKKFIKYDTTELEYTDNLLRPQNVLKELESEISSIYGPFDAFISTNGATSCVYAAVYAAKHKGGFLIAGKAHMSVYNALRINGVKAWQAEGLNEETLKNIPCGVIFTTSPDYFGNCVDLSYYRKLADKYNCLLVVDSSHGSHFVLNDKFPISATKYGDLVIHSLHKTLPAATGAAVLLCNNKELSPLCAQARRLFHSTSPSYITLCSIERAFHIMRKRGRALYDRVYAAVNRFKKKDLGEFEVCSSDDFSRLVLRSVYEGGQVVKELGKMGVDMEMGCQDKVVAIVTPYNYRRLGALAKRLRKINGLKRYVKNEKEQEKEGGKVVELDFCPRKELVDIDSAAGRRAYCEIGIYPPGLPLVLSGEVISQEVAQTIKNNIDNCFGLENNMAPVISYKDGGQR